MSNLKQVTLKELPKCQLCYSPTAQAEYDFVMRTGQWAFGCRACYLEHRRYPTLGTGRGQLLVRARD